MAKGDSFSFRALVLLTDAFGGVGGIQLYNRDLLTALCAHPGCAEVVAVPRKVTYSVDALPDKLTYQTDGLAGALAYCRTVMKVMTSGSFDFLVCCHLNLLPLAWLAANLCRKPLLLVLFGKEAWQPPANPLTKLFLRRVDAFAAISHTTDERFRSWAGVHSKTTTLLPNALHRNQYGPGLKDPALLRRFGLEGKTVLMTFGRLESFQRQKGFDEVLHILPQLVSEYPDLMYLIAGDGPDKGRLEQEVVRRGMTERVRFTGMVPEAEKAQYYRLADVYVMPSRKEGFGFVFLEAMACGIPVIASKSDGSREAVLYGALGALVDPGNPDELLDAVRNALRQPRGVVPQGLDYFSYGNFTRRLHELADKVRGGRA